MKPEIALQLYTVRRQLLQDLEGTLEQVRALGFQHVETYPLPPEISVTQLASALKQQNLAVGAMHESVPEESNFTPILQSSQQYHCRTVIWHGWPRSPVFDSQDGIRQLSEKYHRVSHHLQKYDIQSGLHNHWWEFEPVGGCPAWRVLDKLLDPQIFFELDVYWAKTAGMNPAALLKEFHHRIRFLHLKDGPAVQGQAMTALGTGVLCWPEILAAAPKHVQGVIELDECERDIFRVLSESLRFLQAAH